MAGHHIAPNIIFILIDDMGWRDLSCYGSSFYETPHIDRLAASGMVFSDAYAACPVCSPTRASILTGRYPARLGITNWIDYSNTTHPCRGRLVDAPYIKQLGTTERTVADSLRDGGYATWHVGKWHLGQAPYWPEQHGFAVNIGGCEWGHPRNGYFSPWGIPGLPDGQPGEYLTDHLTDAAIDLIRRHRIGSPRQPFFLNLWYYAVHTPIQAKADLVAKYERKVARLGLDKQQTLVECEAFPIESRKNQRIVRRIIQSNPVYAAMIETLDGNIGRLLALLDELSIRDDTIIIFTSDNGGLSTAAGSPTCNAPLSEGKGWMYEGGVREPLIASWPGHISRGECQVPVISTDFFPTILDLAGLPAELDRHLDGVSLATLLTGGRDPQRDALFWHYPHYGEAGGTPAAAMRAGRYKLIDFFEDDQVELYDLTADPAERHDLAGQLPELAAELRGRLRDWLSDLEASLPQPNTEYQAWRQPRAILRWLD
jgi:arylsulfatase A-like enzyme